MNKQSLPFSALLIGLALPLGSHPAFAKPPTVDPTYGLPMPQAARTSAMTSKASWIWADTTTDNQTVLMRRVVSLSRVPKNSFVSITADDFFTLYVNGKEVGKVPGGPPVSGTDYWRQAHRYNVTRYLRPGANVLAIRGMNGGSAAGVIAQWDVPGQPSVGTDGHWKVLPSTSDPDGWNGRNFDDSSWTTATVIAPLTGGPWEGALTGWPGYEESLAPYMKHITFPVTRVLDVTGGDGKIVGAQEIAGHTTAVLTVTPPASKTGAAPSLVVDFGKEVAGRVRITPLTGGTVAVGTGESTEEAMNSPWGGVHQLALTPGTAAYTSSSAFRYAHLTFPNSSTGNKPVRIRVTLDDKYYPVHYGGSFNCSDPLITKLWYTGAYTAHLCMQEDIWDAPKRDRARWSGDLHVSGEVINDAFADKFLMEQTMTRLRDDAQGGHPASEEPGGHVNGIPGYSCAWICTLADFDKHIGDRKYLMQQHALLLGMLKYMQGDLDDKGLFANKHGAWDYADWSPGFDSDAPGSRAATHLFFIKAAQDAVYLLTQMGDYTNALTTKKWAYALLVTAHQSLLSSDTNTYGDRLEENSMAVFSGTATPGQDADIYSKVLKLSSPSWDHTGEKPYNPGVVSPYYGSYVLRALSGTGHTEEGLKLLRSFWGGMLTEGATTFWEAYDPHWIKKPFHENLYADGNHGTYVSLCHGWSAGPTSWLTDVVLGIQPTSSGYRTVDIAPDLGDLKWAEGSVPTPHGPLHVRVEKTASGLTCQVTVPSGVHARVLLPGKAPQSLAHAGTFTVL